MNIDLDKITDVPDPIFARIAVLFKEQQQAIIRHTDRLFSWLMIFQWFFAVGIAFWLSPRTWSGVNSEIHPHIWAAVFLGGIITALPVYLARTQPGKTLTRHVVAIGQMLMSGLLIHLTGGRIETHFHVFGSLAILSFYRDWPVLISATVVTAVDHVVRGIFWPESVYGVLYAPLWRSFEHAGWVVFEVTFLIIANRKSVSELHLAAERQAKLEAVNETIERTVTERTAELTRENRERLQSQALYTSLVEQLPAGIFRKDADGRYVFANSWFCNLRGKSPNEIVGKTADELVALETDKRNVELLRPGIDHHKEIMRTGNAIEVIEEYHGANNKLLHLQIIKTPVFGADGNTIGSQGILVDITERKRAEAELNRERNLLRTIITNSPDAIYVKDTTGRKTMVNPAELKIMGCKTEAEVVGKSDFEMYPHDLAAQFFADDQAVIQSGQPLVNREEKVIALNGEARWILSSKNPLRDVDGKVVGLVGMGRDITGIKEAEAKLSEVHRQLMDASRQAGMAEVATSVLHNVGNVLNSVNVSSSLIADKIRNSKVVNITKVVALMSTHENDLGNFFANDPKGKQLPDYLAGLAAHLAQEQEDILNEVGSLVNNIAHIREIVAMQQGYAKASGILETLKITDLIEDAVRMNDGAMIRHNVKVTRNFANVPPVSTDKHKVLQILVNLIRNAKYACDDSGKQDKQITLRVWNGDGRVKISVIDNGIGIPAENLTRIFSHGFTTRKEGHGFGLHSGALAAKELGGTLMASSEGIGEGATFTLELPVQKEKIDL